MGLPWLDQPIEMHSFREPMCMLNSTDDCAYQSYFWRNWYEADYAYGQTTVIAICLGILIAAFVNLVNQIQRLSSSADILSSSWHRRGHALLRATSRTIRGYPVSSALFAGLVATYTLLMTLAPQPYVWPTADWGDSPPIATRTGWIAVCSTPQSA